MSTFTIPSRRPAAAAMALATWAISWGCSPDRHDDVQLDAAVPAPPDAGGADRGVTTSPPDLAVSPPDSAAPDLAPDAAPTSPDADESPVVTVPFPLDDYFVASGYMGDGSAGGVAEMPW